MNLAILHYHLNRGGVSRVIENHLAALDGALEPGDRWNVAILSGGRRDDWPDDLPERLRAIRLRFETIPELEYDTLRQQPEPTDSAALAEQIDAALKRLDFGASDTILHVHNHALGKNVRLPASLARLAAQGYRLLLQSHDFAEDFRPDNYRAIREAQAAGELYPQGPLVHYAVLNGRDRDILHRAGFGLGRLHLLANPVPERTDLPPRAAARRRLAEQFGIGENQPFWLYPVRAIRRKNLGEAVLCSLLAPPGTIVGVTLRPLNPAEAPVYERWVALAAELRLPCLFEVGAPGALGFAENLAAADAILTTSVAEGFGMVFLEAWLADRPLIGRDLPEITRDYVDAGLQFEWLWPRLDVPLEWIGRDAFRETLLAAYRRTLAVYDRVEPADLAERLDEKIVSEQVDFADLDETLQERVIRAAHDDPQKREQLLQANPRLRAAMELEPGEAAETVAHNADAVRRGFSLTSRGKRLLGIYRQVAASPTMEPPPPLAEPGRILDQFLQIQRFRVIRS